ncbi:MULTISPECIES: hypothetical protein [unclassified Pseudoxanthomonas]|uniref:2'-5' RNA ligase family protein n=1 Tax=unclassified Pseudoxanthomonas TaxID=2645906 RepID=UPI00307EA911
MLQRFISIGLIRELGTTLFPSGNWHQSFSERIFDPTTRDRDALLRVGDRISARACTLLFNRIEGPDLAAAKQHCTLRAYGKPKAFLELLASVQRSLADAGFSQIATGVTPHITLSYRATRTFDSVPLAPAISWTIDTLCLVIGSGDPYRYEVIGRWPLLSELDPPATQPSLF